MSVDVVKTLTYDERATWGECPVCHAPHGQACNPYTGSIFIFTNAFGEPPQNGAHLGRLNGAPFKVRLVPCD